MIYCIIETTVKRRKKVWAICQYLKFLYIKMGIHSLLYLYSAELSYEPFADFNGENIALVNIIWKNVSNLGYYSLA